MKPIVIYVENIENDKVILNREDLESYIKQAYDQGKTDGTVINNPIIYPSYPTNPYYPLITYTTTPTWTTDYDYTTCCNDTEQIN
jgi:hypothetical protein